MGIHHGRRGTLFEILCDLVELAFCYKFPFVDSFQVEVGPGGELVYSYGVLISVS